VGGGGTSIKKETHGGAKKKQKVGQKGKRGVFLTTKPPGDPKAGKETLATKTKMQPKRRKIHKGGGGKIERSVGGKRQKKKKSPSRVKKGKNSKKRSREKKRKKISKKGICHENTCGFKGTAVVPPRAIEMKKERRGTKGSAPQIQLKGVLSGK